MSDVGKKAEAKLVSIVSENVWAQRLYNEALRNLIIFGTSMPHIYKKPTTWQRIKWAVHGFFGRAGDAWKVLIGKAEIYEGQDD